MSSAIIARYEAQKRARSWLGSTTLIVRTAALFANPDYGAWVRYKLDAGIDHILSMKARTQPRAMAGHPRRWQGISSMARAPGGPKTLFAVGDPKQSIYSFQGAEPALFLETGRKTGHKAKTRTGRGTT